MTHFLIQIDSNHFVCVLCVRHTLCVSLCLCAVCQTTGGSSQPLPVHTLSSEPFLPSFSIESFNRGISPVCSPGQSGLVNTCCPSHCLGKYSSFLPQFLSWSKSQQFVNMDEIWGKKSHELRLAPVLTSDIGSKTVLVLEYSFLLP